MLAAQVVKATMQIASDLAKAYSDIVVAVYAGAGKSGLFRGEEFSSVEREYVKISAKRHEIELLIATDAAYEGLNFQALGTLI